jgi:hypothetical protein
MDPRAYNTIIDFGPLLSKSWWWYVTTFFAIGLGWSCSGVLGEWLRSAMTGLLRWISADIEAARLARATRGSRAVFRREIMERRRRERDARK